jgi:hypothetical protein
MPAAAHWKSQLKPQDGQRWPIRCGLVLSAHDVARLREGLWPRDMDDRWAIWLDEEVLRAWRSWTGVCVYEGRVLVLDDGSAVVSVLDVLDQPDHYVRASSDGAELERFEGVIGLALSPQVA